MSADMGRTQASVSPALELRLMVSLYMRARLSTAFWRPSCDTSASLADMLAIRVVFSLSLEKLRSMAESRSSGAYVRLYREKKFNPYSQLDSVPVLSMSQKILLFLESSDSWTVRHKIRLFEIVPR